jgi:DNA-binding NtrC family response regulator
MVARGLFREDLFYRLNLIEVRLPSLAERRGDVAELAHHFLDLCSRTYRRGAPAVAFTDRAVAWLAAQGFPGNVRQLRQTIERAVLVHGGDLLDAGDFAALAGLATPAGRDGLDARGSALPNPGSMTLDEMEKAMIEQHLRHYGGNVTRVAQALGLSRAALYRRFEKYGIVTP